MDIAAWDNINCSNTVKTWIQEGVPLPFESDNPCGPFKLQNHHLSVSHKHFIDEELSRLIQCGAISEVYSPPQCISPLGCVSKKSGKYRLIVDLRQLNSHLLAAPFQNEDIKAVASVIQPNDLMISVDLKDGFYHVPLHPKYRTYLGVEWKRKFYVWNVLCFGLSISPYYFYKVLRPVTQHLRQMGLRLTVFVDDFLLMADAEHINNHADILVRTLTELGWKINWEKSHLSASCVREYIGYKIDSVGENGAPTLHIPAKRIRRLCKDLKRVLAKGSCSARCLARITGQCVSMARAILPGKLLLRNTYRLLKQRDSWDDLLVLDEATIRDLQWWLHASPQWNGRPISLRPVDKQLTTDASQTGWGAWVEEGQAYGHWNMRMSHKSSNYRELMSVLLGLYSFVDILQGKHVQVISDNITTVSYVMCQGGSCKELSQLATAIWAMAVENQIYLTSRHLAGVLNTQADVLSRIGGRYEWRLHRDIFRHIDATFGPHTVDRFASLANHQLPRYNSRFADPNSDGIDALSQDNWNQENNYVCCPFRLIPKVLDIVKLQKAMATIVVPVWPAQTWFHQLQALAVAPPIPIPVSPRSVIKCSVSHHTVEPLRNAGWRLQAWKIYGGKS